MTVCLERTSEALPPEGSTSRWDRPASTRQTAGGVALLEGVVLLKGVALLGTALGRGLHKSTPRGLRGN